MKKLIVIAMFALALGATAAPAFASTANGTRDLSRLQFAADYARAIATFQIDGRTFLVQENPQTNLEIKTKLYWLELQLVNARLAELTNTWK